MPEKIQTDTDISEEKILEELGGPRQLIGWQGALIFVIGLAWSLFQLSLASVLILNSTLIRSIHLAFAFSIVYISYPVFKKPRLSGVLSSVTKRERFHPFELIIAIIAVIMALYIALDYTGIAERIGSPIPRDRAFGILLFVMLLEAARRVVGPALPVLASLFTLYAFFGPYMPSLIAFKGISLDRFLGQITMSTEGIFGVPLGVSANIVFLFVLFGSMLEKAGGGNYFIQLSTSLLGSFRGGPAKAAILSSGLTGMINGSSIANVVTTGTFTIPLMKSVGYPPKKAGAIEVASSVGGQLMPPIMGAAAFIMAEYVNLPYIEVVKAAFLPAFVAYSALFYISHLEACKLGLQGLPRSELPRFIPTFVSGLHYLIPIGVLIYKLVFLRHTPESSAFLATIFLAVLILVQEPVKAGIAGHPLLPAFRKGVILLFDGLVQGARNNVTVAVACASAGIIVGIVTMGPGGMLTEAVSYISGGNIYLLLFITAIACLILGMGLPTTANYIVMASLTAPIIVQVGGAAGLIVPLMAAHLFVFYFGILADDTPPVGLAAYAAAAIAKSDPIATGVQGFTYDIRTAVLPFMFIFNTELILWDITSWPVIIMLFLTAAFGGLTFASATQNWLITRNRWYETIGLLAVTLISFQPQIPAMLFGYEMKYLSYFLAFGLWGLVYFSQRLRIQKTA
ncbi:TRAP transporter permease [bacterium]|nr:TRAP transporter permease [bacterium]